MEKNRAPGLNPETVFKLTLVILGLIIAAVSINLGFGSLRRPGPGLFPFLAGLLLAISSLSLLIFGRPRASGPLFERSEFIKYLALIGVLLFWVALLKVLGYVVVTFFAALAIAWIMGLRGWHRLLALSLGTAAFIFLIFDLWLYLDLPQGFWS